MSSTARLWVFSPVYQDVESFRVLKREFLSALGSLDFRPRAVTFVVVDDSAGFDPEMSQLRGEADIRVLTPPFNLGHQRALVFGLRMLKDELADEDVIVTLDADGEDQPLDVPRLLAPLLAQGDDVRRIALALRTRRRESWTFKLLYAAFRVLFITLTGTLVRTGNFAAYRGWTARRVLFHPSFDLCYSSSLLALNRPLELIPCERGVRYAGRSRMGFLKLLMHGIRMLMPFLDRIAIRALVAFSVTFALAAAFAAWVIGIKLFTRLAIPGWATYTVLLVLLLSFVAVGNFVILFALFSQSQGVSLSFLDRDGHGPA